MRKYIRYLIGILTDNQIYYHTAFKVTKPFARTVTSLLTFAPGISSFSQRFITLGFRAGHVNLTVSAVFATDRKRTMTAFPSAVDLRMETVTAAYPSNAISGLEIALVLAASGTRGCACSNPKRLAVAVSNAP
jgi:hypothetical protein